jgi:hypothetical protein
MPNDRQLLPIKLGCCSRIAGTEMSVEERIKHFRADLPNHEVADLVRKHVTSGDCFTLSPTSYYELRARIAGKFEIHPTEVVVVGSAKLGFSIAPDKRYREFGETSGYRRCPLFGRAFRRLLEGCFRLLGTA